MIKKIIIAGDSHTRSFGYRDNILPVFFGPGKEFNLNPKSVKKVQKAINLLYAKYDSINSDIYLYLGEPNVRFQLGYGWYPHLESKVVSKIDKEYLQICAENYIRLAKLNNASIITPTTGFNPMLSPMHYFNQLILKQEEVKIIDLFSGTLSGSMVNPFFLNKDLNNDPIHLNSNIADLFIEKACLNRKKYSKMNNIKVLDSNDLKFGTIKLYNKSLKNRFINFIRGF